MIIRSAEKNYYAAKLSNLQNNMAKTWKVLNAMINKQNSKKIISEINIGGVTSDDPAEISEKFNIGSRPTTVFKIFVRVENLKCTTTGIMLYICQ